MTNFLTVNSETLSDLSRITHASWDALGLPSTYAGEVTKFVSVPDECEAEFGEGVVTLTLQKSRIDDPRIRTNVTTKFTAKRVERNASGMNTGLVAALYVNPLDATEDTTIPTVRYFSAHPKNLPTRSQRKLIYPEALPLTPETLQPTHLMLALLAVEKSID